MNLSNFIAKRWTYSSPFPHSKLIIRLGVGCIALCMMLMVLSVCVLYGFKQEIKKKVYGFGAHLQIRPYFIDANGNQYVSLELDSTLIAHIEGIPGLKSYQSFAYKGGIIHKDTYNNGVFFKGLPSDYDSSFFVSKLVDGRLPDFGTTGEISSEILISSVLAKKMQIRTGDKVRAYFLDGEQLRPRAFQVSGIYRSGLQKIDEIYVFCDLRQIQRLNRWKPDEVEGIDIQIEEPEKAVFLQQTLLQTLPYQYNCYIPQELFPDIFDWLALTDTNVWVLMIIMTLVALISIISLISIFMMEREADVRMLRNMGAGSALIRSIFVKQSLYIIGLGLIIGDVAAILVALLQKYLHIFKLDEEIYYLSYVPIEIPFPAIIGVNVLCLILVYGTLRISSRRKE